MADSHEARDKCQPHEDRILWKLQAELGDETISVLPWEPKGIQVSVSGYPPVTRPTLLAALTELHRSVQPDSLQPDSIESEAKCPDCHGSGQITRTFPNTNRSGNPAEATGGGSVTPCSTCKGSGSIESERGE